MPNHFINRIRNPLVFPSGINPRFDPTHIAAKGITPSRGCSIIATGNNCAVDLTTGKTGVNSTALSSKIRPHIGVVMDYTGAHNIRTSFSGKSTANDSTFTFGGIIILGTVAAGVMIGASSTGTGGLNFGSTSSGAIAISAQNVASITSTITLLANVPYFVAASHTGTSNLFIARRLDTGRIVTSVVSGSLSPNAPNGTYSFGSDDATAFGAYNAALMFSPAYMSMNQLMLWANDPWAFWYPPSYFSSFIPSVKNNRININAGSVESITFADTTSQTNFVSTNINETDLFFDDFTSIYFAVNIAESIALIDRASQTYPVSNSESISLSDSFSAMSHAIVSVSDSLTFADSESSDAGWPVHESLSLLDTQSVSVSSVLNVQERITFLDRPGASPAGYQPPAQVLGQEGPLYFAWVDANTPFNPVTHAVMDEDIIEVEVNHQEGEFAAMELVIKNRRAPSGNAWGFLNPTRKQWAYLSEWDGSQVVPRFHGRVVGPPAGVSGESISYHFLARSDDFLALKATLADTLRELPQYDPVFVAADQFANPNAVLDAISGMWHIDRITHAVTVSDILDGEDGLKIFNTADILYNSLDPSYNGTPLQSVSANVRVSWDQLAFGEIDLGSRTIDSYSGGGLVSDWPKPLSSVGEGWRVKDSLAIDVYGVSTTPTVTYSWEYHNKAKKHFRGDLLTANESKSSPALIGPSWSAIVSSGGEIVMGGPDWSPFTPEGETSLQDYLDSQFNINRDEGNPRVSIHYSNVYVPLYKISTSISFSYAADRKKVEVLKTALAVDIQPIVTNQPATPTDDSTPSTNELVTITGNNVGTPLFTSATLTSNGTNVSNGDIVEIGDHIYTFLSTLGVEDGDVQIGPDAASSLDNLRRAIILGGVAGVAYSLATTIQADVFASISGLVLTVKSSSGAVVPVSTTAASLIWSNRALISGLVDTLSSVDGLNLADGVTVTVGSATYVFQDFMDNALNAVKIAGSITATLTNLHNAINATGGVPGTDYAIGTLKNSTVIATISGNVLTVYGTTLDLVNASVGANYTFRGEWLPNTAYPEFDVVTYGGQLYQSTRNQNSGGLGFGGGAWKAVGTIKWSSPYLVPSDPSAIAIGDTGRRSYFASDRGQLSIQNILLRLRARARFKARAVRIPFECTWRNAAALSCRMNAQVNDGRIPGGTALGKVMSYSFSLKRGRKSGKVEIGCAVGNATPVVTVTGTPVYVSANYVSGWQQYTGETFLLPSGDIGYARPSEPSLLDDGLVFPLTKSQAVIRDEVIGSPDEQLLAVQTAVPNMSVINLNPVLQQKAIFEATVQAQAQALSSVPLWREIELRPVTGGPFAVEYIVHTSILSIDKGIDLAAG